LRAVVIARPGGPEVLELRDVPRPVPKRREVLVRVYTSALNRADVLQRQGRYPAPSGAAPDIPGLEIAGEVAELGPDAGRWAIGERVFGIIGGGGYAEYAAIHEQELAKIPANFSWEEAAGVPEVFITAHDALISQAHMARDEAVLVHAVGSGVGLAVVQLVRAFGGVCYGTARTADKIERAKALGLRDGAVIADPADVVGHVNRWTNGRGADVILDLVGGGYATANVECAAARGRIILIGLLAGRSATMNLGAVLSKRLMVQGTTMRSRSGPEKAAATQAFEWDVLPLLERGEVKPIVDRVFPLEQIRDAHALLESNETFGKLVIRIA
jgi:NADPH2:quinone reductase